MSSDYFSRKNRLARRDARAGEIKKLAGGFSRARHDAVTTQNVGPKAIDMVKSVLSNFILPAGPALSYSGTRKARFVPTTSELDDGVVTVHAALKTHSGVGIEFDIPIEIRAGQLMEPSVLVVNGAPKIIAQSSFDDIVHMNSIHDPVHAREMFAPPGIAVKKSTIVKRNQGGMFSIKSNKQALVDAMRLGTYREAAPQEGPELEERLEQMDSWGEPSDEELSQIEHEQEFADADRKLLEALMQQTSNPELQKKILDILESEKLGYDAETPRFSQPTGPSLCQGCGKPAAQCECEESPIHGMEAELDKSAKAPPGMEDTVLKLKKQYPGEPEKAFATAWSIYNKKAQYKEPDYEGMDPARNQDDMDHLDPAERRQYQDLHHAGEDASLSEELEVKDRGGVAHKFKSGAKVHLVRDLAGDGKHFVVQFESGLQAIVDANYLRG